MPIFRFHCSQFGDEEVELHLTSPTSTHDLRHGMTGLVRLPATPCSEPILHGASVRIRSLATGLTEEAFLDPRGAFALEVELQPETDNALELTVCDSGGAAVARVVTCVRQQSQGQPLSQTAPPTPVHSRPLPNELLDPPWPGFAQLVRRCLDLAAEVTKATGRDPEELFAYVHAQERYAEQARKEHHPAHYRECRANLEQYADYLDGLLRDRLPRPPVGPLLPPEDEARAEAERFRNQLSAVWKQVRAQQRADLEPRLAEIARQASGLTQRIKREPDAVVREARRLETEVSRIEELLREHRRRDR